MNKESLLTGSYYIPMIGHRDDVKSKLREEIKIKLLSVTRNELAKTLLSMNTSNENEILIDNFSTMNPYQAKIASAIYQGSN